MTETTELERELRAALSEAHSDAPEPPGLADRLVAAATSGPSIPPGSRVRMSRRWLRPLAAAAAVLTLALGIDAIVTSQRDDDSQPATTNPGLNTPLIAPESLLDVRKLGFHVAPVHGIEVTDSWGIDSDAQWTDVYVGDDARWAVVKVYYQGRSPKPPTGTSEDVTVNGLPGTYTENVRSGLYTARLIWRYAPDSWAEVGISGDGAPPPDLREQYLTVAEAVQTGGQTLLLPVRFDSAPASLPSISKADRVTGESSGEWTIYVWVDDVLVSVTNAVDLSECVGDGGEPQTAEFTYRGHRGCVVPTGDQERVVLHLDGVDVTYDFDPSRDRPLEDIKQLLDGVTVVPPSYHLTAWFDLKTALGG